MLFGRELLFLFILEVTECSGKVQISVNTSFSNNTTNGLNSLSLNVALGLMIETEGDALASGTETASRVTRISNEDLLELLVDADDVRSATNGVKHEISTLTLSLLSLGRLVFDSLRLIRLLHGIL